MHLRPTSKLGYLSFKCVYFLYKCELLSQLSVCCSHEVADVAGLTSFSFGQEEDDRYVMVWKKVKPFIIYDYD